jgi:hypothetical protein
MSQTTPSAAPMTVVLVHGAFADASSWTGVIDMKGIHHESKQALARRETPRSSSITH